MSKTIEVGIVGASIYIFLLIGGIVGWGINAVRFFQSDFEPSYKREIVRGIGIVIPVVGAVAGYCDIEDTTK